jgi:hypothetical protein
MPCHEQSTGQQSKAEPFRLCILRKASHLHNEGQLLAVGLVLLAEGQVPAAEAAAAEVGLAANQQHSAGSSTRDYEACCKLFVAAGRLQQIKCAEGNPMTARLPKTYAVKLGQTLVKI